MEHIWIVSVYLDSHKAHIQKVSYDPNNEKQVHNVFSCILKDSVGIEMAGFKELEKATEWIHQQLSKLEEGDTNG